MLTNDSTSPRTFTRQFDGPHEVADLATLRDIYRLRAEVWASTGNVAADAFGPDGWHDAWDDAATHWAIFDDCGKVAAAARLTLHARVDDLDEAEVYAAFCPDLPGPVAAPARVVVRRESQGFGLAQRLLTIQEQAARAQGAQWALRQASPQMVPLLRRRGWEILGPGAADPRFPELVFQVAKWEVATGIRDNNGAS